MDRKKLVVAASSIAGAGMGFLVGRAVGRRLFGVVAGASLLGGRITGGPVLGAVTGLAIALPVSVWATSGRRRWFFTSILNLLIIASFVRGGWPTALFALAVTALTFIISASCLRELYGGNEWVAMWHHAQVVSGLTAFHIIEDGETVIPKKDGPKLGPLLTIIRPENAAVLYKGSKETRITGPAVFRTEAYEYVKRIYDLRQKPEPFSFADVLTHDLMTTHIDLTVTYGIKVSAGARRGERPFTAAEIETLKLMDSWVPDHDRLARDAIEASVREVARALDLDPLLAVGSHAGLERQILQLANRRLRPWGVEAQQVTINRVLPQQDVQDAASGRWIAGAEAQTLRVAERARALAWKEALTLLARGYRIATQLGMPPEGIHREVLRRTFEQIAKDPASKVIFTPDLLSALADLRQSIDAGAPST